MEPAQGLFASTGGHEDQDLARDSSAPEDPMPTFTIAAADDLALLAMLHYKLLCTGRGLEEFGAEVQKAFEEMRAWRERNPDKCHLPDHRHASAR